MGILDKFVKGADFKIEDPSEEDKHSTIKRLRSLGINMEADLREKFLPRAVEISCPVCNSRMRVTDVWVIFEVLNGRLILEYKYVCPETNHIIRFMEKITPEKFEEILGEITPEDEEETD